MALPWYAILFIILGILVALLILLQSILNHLLRNQKRYLNHKCVFCRINRYCASIYISGIEIYQWGLLAFFKRRVKKDRDTGLPFYNKIYRQKYEPEDPPLTPHLPHRPRRREQFTEERQGGPSLQFFTLPAEIRREIYKAFADTFISLKCAPTRYSRPGKKFMKATALLRTCRQTRHEYLPIFFRSVLFLTDAEFPFYKKIFFPARSVIRHLYINTDSRAKTSYGLKKMLLDVVFMRSLRELHIVTDAWSLFVNGHDVLDLMSVDKVTQLPDLVFGRVTATCEAGLEVLCRGYLEWVLLKAKKTWPKGVKLERYTDHVPGGEVEIQSIVIRTLPYDSRFDYRAVSSGNVRIDEPCD